MTALETRQNPAELGRQLSQLEQLDLIRLAAVRPELEYVFRHALLEESAYHTLVRADRRRIHRAAGQALEILFSDNPQSSGLSLQLARHFEEAADDARALRYYVLAGDAAAAQYANTEAVTAYTRALDAAERTTLGAQPSPTPIETWQHLFASRGRALELNSQYLEALANYEAMARRAEALGSRHLALSAAVSIGQLYATATPLFDPPQAERMAEVALSEARALGDEGTEAKILWNQLNLYRFTRRNSQARLSGEQSLEIANRLGLKEQAALTLNDLIHIYSALGLWAQARQAADDAGRQWRALGNRAMLADSLATTSLYSSLVGDFATALGRAQEAQQLSVTIGNLWGQSYSFSGMALPNWYLGQPDRAIENCEACIRLGRLAGYRFSEVLDQARLGYMLGELGDTAQALRLLAQAEAATKYAGVAGLAPILSARIHLELQTLGVEQAVATLQYLETAAHTPGIWEVDAVLRARSEVALAQGDAARALTVTQAHVAGLQELGLLTYLPEALVNLARAFGRLDLGQQAREALLEARDRVDRMHAPMLAWIVLYELGKLEAEQSRPAEAAAAWQRAREIVVAIAARVPTPELRASFRARSEVCALFGEPGPSAAVNIPAAPAWPAP